MIFPVLLSALVLAPVAPARGASTRTVTRVRSVAPEVLPFIADDWPKAVALAKARKVPLFVEAWAPW